MSASWINPVERWFADLIERQIHGGTHRSTQDPEAVIEAYLAVHNEHPRPFVGTKSADKILRSLKRCCRGIGETVH